MSIIDIRIIPFEESDISDECYLLFLDCFTACLMYLVSDYKETISEEK
jgi:hypothetical protein